jgi:hypothetical protein
MTQIDPIPSIFNSHQSSALVPSLSPFHIPHSEFDTPINPPSNQSKIQNHKGSVLVTFCAMRHALCALRFQSAFRIPNSAFQSIRNSSAICILTGAAQSNNVELILRGDLDSEHNSQKGGRR